MIICREKRSIHVVCVSFSRQIIIQYRPNMKRHDLAGITIQYITFIHERGYGPQNVFS